MTMLTPNHDWVMLCLMNTTTNETTTARKALSPSTVLASIEGASLPAPTGEAIRSLGTTEQCSKIRAMFKAAGVKGVSVKRSHAGWSATVSVSFVAAAHDCDAARLGRTRLTCESCCRAVAAERKAEAMIIAAFPDCGNRSDAMTDYFDYVFSVHSEHA